MARHFIKMGYFSLERYISKQMKKEYGIDCIKKYGIPSFDNLVQEMKNYYSMMDYKVLLSLKVEYGIRTFSVSSTGDSIARNAVTISLFGIFASCYVATVPTFLEKVSFTLAVSVFTLLLLLLNLIEILTDYYSNRKKKYLLFKQQCIKEYIGNWTK